VEHCTIRRAREHASKQANVLIYVYEFEREWRLFAYMRNKATHSEKLAEQIGVSVWSQSTVELNAKSTSAAEGGVWR
jgi:hypothetical protein